MNAVVVQLYLGRVLDLVWRVEGLHLKAIKLNPALMHIIPKIHSTLYQLHKGLLGLQSNLHSVRSSRNALQTVRMLIAVLYQ